MVTPVRYTSGITQDAPWQPLARMGTLNPFFYHLYEDDFDGYNTTNYTATTTGNGTIANAAADGGALLFTTNSSTPASTDIASLQLKAANFQIVPGKKLFFGTRIVLANQSNPAWNVGLMNTTVTPFAATDGVYFSKAANSTTVNLVSVVGSTATSTVLTTLSAQYAAASTGTFIDLFFEITSKDSVLVSAGVGVSLVGYTPQSGIGANTPATLSPQARISGLTLTTALLNPTLAIQSGAAASITMQSDFLLAAKER